MSQPKSRAEELADRLASGWPSLEDVNAAVPELRRLSAEVEALRNDAERYRWIRTKARDWGICEWDRNECEWVRDSRGAVVIDAAIDAARLQASEGVEGKS